jgi:hypothetical protein
MRNQQLNPHTFGFKVYLVPGGVEMLADPSFNQAFSSGTWQTNDPTNWSIDLAAGKAVNIGGGGQVYQTFDLVTNATYNIEIELEGRDGGGIYFEFINPQNNTGVGYRNLPNGLNQFTFTASASETRQFAIKSNQGGGRVLRASLKRV